MGVCNCSLFWCTLLYAHSSLTVILMGKRLLVALLSLSSWCLVVVVWFFLTVPWACLQFVIVVFPDHTNLLIMNIMRQSACLVVNPITIFINGFHLNFTRVGQASDSMMALT